MSQERDDLEIGHFNDPQKSDWAEPRVVKLFAGDAESNPGDSHADGPTTFS